jgi:hypothetical protein
MNSATRLSSLRQIVLSAITPLLILLPEQTQAQAARTAARSLAQAIEREGVILYDAFGAPLKGTALKQIQPQAGQHFSQELEQVLWHLAPTNYKSEADFNRALQSALKTSAKSEYSFDVTSGKLKLKYKTERGEVTGELNPYSVAKAAIGLGIAGSESARTPPPPVTPPPQAPLQPKYVARCVFYQSAVQYLITSTCDVIAIVPEGNTTFVGTCTSPTYPGFSYMLPGRSGLLGVDAGGTIFGRAPNGLLIQVGYVTNPLAKPDA